MEFVAFNPLRGGRDQEQWLDAWARLKAGWESFGWREIPRADQSPIEAAWAAHLQPADRLEIPRPNLMWRGQALAAHRAHPELEAEFTLKLLAAFRRCTRPGERLWAIDWQHAWYDFDPNAPITAATRDQWAMPILPGGDSSNFVAPDFRFGVVSGWRETGPVTLFGADLLAAFAANPPEQFVRRCGPGKRAPA